MSHERPVNGTVTKVSRARGLWSDSRTTHLLVVGDAPNELIEVPVRRQAKVEMGYYSSYDPGVGLPKILGTGLDGKFPSYVLPEKAEKVQLHNRDWLVGRHDRERENLKGHVTTPGGRECWVITSKILILYICSLSNVCNN